MTDTETAQAVHADAELVEQVLCDGLDYWGHELDDVSGRVVAVAPRAKRYEAALAALARLVAALPDAPAETHTPRAPQWFPNNETGGAQTTPFPSSRAGDVPAGDAG